jgi:dephospho-CoA kinase
MDTDVEYQRKVINAFGTQILDERGVIDRTKLGAVIFANPEKRRLLDKMSHPLVFRKIIKSLFKLKFIQRRPLVVLDAPLLFEAKILEYFCYPIIVVYCEDGQKQLKRLMERNSLTADEAIAKVNSQMPISLKVKKADIAIENGGTLKDLEKAI